MTNISIKQTTPHISIRASGKQGPQGPKGDTGATGPQGPKGDPGTTDYNELENLPDLTLKADKATTYTKTEVDTALTGKANTVHTHVATDVIDFDTNVSSNSDVSANTAARHTHANKTILDATTASYTSADKTKLDGIEAGAEVNTVTSVNTRTGAVTGLAEASDLTAHTGNTSNPHSVTKAQVGLGNVDNTSDANKPVSTAQQSALNAKANASDTVNLTGNQTVAGVKTFSGSPIVPTATTGTQAVNKDQMDTADAAHVAATDPHTQYMNSDRGDARYAGKPYSVMAKSQFASLPSSYGTLGRIFGNDGYKNDLQVYGLSTQAGTPTPDAPVPIVSTTGNVTVNSRNKNLFNANLQTANFRNVVVSSIDNSITLKSTMDNVCFTTYRINGIQPNTTYTLSRDISITGGTGSAADGVVYIHFNSVYYTNMFKNQQSKTFTTDSTTTYLEILFYTYDAPKGSYVEMTVANTNIQLEVGGTKTVAEKNINSTQTLPLGTTQLRSLPNGVSDRIYKDGSTWKLEQNVGTVILNGSASELYEASTRPNGTQLLCREPVLGKAGTPDSIVGVFSDRFIGIPLSSRDTVANSVYSYSLDGLIRFNTTVATTQAQFKTWLAANPTTVYYTLATPTTTTITDPTLITALENIRTYQGVTNITASTPMSGSYGLDLTNTLAGKVDTTGDQTIAGVKTFTSAPIAPSGTSIGGALHLTGTGFPNGVVSAPVGSIYIDKAITNGIAIWYKKTGTASTGWIPLSLSSTPPATATSTGISGQTAYDSNYYYICVATNTWKRTPLSSW